MPYSTPNKRDKNEYKIEFIWVSIKFTSNKPTCLKLVRLYEMLLKHWNEMGFCVKAQRIGSFCCKSSGNEWKSNSSSTISLDSKAFVNRCPSSHRINNKQTVYKIRPVDIESIFKSFSLYDWKIWWKIWNIWRF